MLKKFGSAIPTDAPKRLTVRPWLPTLLAAFLLIADSSSFAAPKHASDTKSQTDTVGIGHKAVVTLANGSKVKGVIAATDVSGFSLDKGKAGITQYSYADVRGVQRDGMSGKKKAVVITASVVGVVVVGAIVVGVLVDHLCSHQCPGQFSTCSCTSSLDRPNPVPVN